MSKNILSEQTGEALRDQALQSAREYTSAHFKSVAADVLLVLAQTSEPFTVETLRDRVGDPAPCHRGVMGALVSAALKRGLIRSIGFTRAARPTSHCRHLRVFCGA